MTSDDGAVEPQPEDRGERTALAGDRTMLANERTLAAWWRTAMGALAAAVAFVGLYGDVQPRWLIRGGASCLVLLTFVILAVAFRRYRATARRIENEYVQQVSTWALWLGTLLLGLTAAVAGAALWLL